MSPLKIVLWVLVGCTPWAWHQGQAEAGNQGLWAASEPVAPRDWQPASQPGEAQGEKDGEIPDTGGGLSGFIASLLWHVYVYFPFPGTWDWLLLVFVLAVASHVGFLPYLWKGVQADMKIFSEGKVLAESETYGSQTGWPLLSDMLCMWLLVWFFHTPAGRTLLEGRAWLGSGAPSETAGGFFWVSLIVHLVIFLPLAAFGGFKPEKKVSQADRSGPFLDRGLESLYGGGGMIVRQTEKGTLERLLAPPPVAVEILVVLLPAHVLYWYWSIASLSIMLSFTIAGLLNEAVRMGFVYVLHKRTFG